MTRRTNLWRHFYGQFGDLAEPANLDRCLDTMRRYKRLVGLETDWERLRVRRARRRGHVPAAVRAPAGPVRRAPGTSTVGRQVVAHGAVRRPDRGGLPGRADPPHDPRSARPVRLVVRAVEGAARRRRRGGGRMALVGADRDPERARVPRCVPHGALRDARRRPRGHARRDLRVHRRAVRPRDAPDGRSALAPRRRELLLRPPRAGDDLDDVDRTLRRGPVAAADRLPPADDRRRDDDLRLRARARCGCRSARASASRSATCRSSPPTSWRGGPARGSGTGPDGRSAPTAWSSTERAA